MWTGNVKTPFDWRRIMRRFITLVALGIAGSGIAAGLTAAQIPTEFQNLQVLPEDIPRDSLIQLELSLLSSKVRLRWRDGELRETGDGRGGEGVAVVGADAVGEAERAEEMAEPPHGGRT
jgi:hypothetical protein